ncbi:MAG: putative viral replication protein [Cressdnaviricota sp.]|nr:MAG: putative viral replication protein [Cressdnaviricota sp.]
MSTDTPDTVRHTAGNTTKAAVCSFLTQRSRAWSFTLNNYTDDDIKFFCDTLDTAKYMFQEETGEIGTPHLQGVIYFENARTGKQMKELHSKVHWEKTKCLKGSVNYCCKEETRTGKIYHKGWSPPEQLDIITNLYDWQQTIVDLLKTKPDKRTIHWFWEPVGNRGKTELCKYILTQFQHVQYFTGGEAKDIAFQIINETWTPKIVIFDFPRTSEGKVSYNSIESVKNGLVQSGKYKGGRKIFNAPHVIIMANWGPDTSRLSDDRWHIVHL